MTPALVSGPLCLNVDVLHPAAPLPELERGDALIVRDAGAYQQAQSTRFGDLQPAVLARDDGRWRVCRRRETLDDLLAGDIDVVLAGTSPRRRGHDSAPLLDRRQRRPRRRPSR